ncbi:MAG: tetratricopeptide repeat protein [Halobacteriota archaeon]
MAQALTYLGNILEQLGEYTQSKECAERALKIYRAYYGEEHPDVAIQLVNIGVCLQNLGDYVHAKEYNEQALAIFKATYNEKHPLVFMLSIFSGTSLRIRAITFTPRNTTSRLLLLAAQYAARSIPELPSAEMLLEPFYWI